MQILIIGSVYETAEWLDARRLRRQILDCDQVLRALMGETKHWRTHPCVLQYRWCEDWLINYKACLQAYLDRCPRLALQYSQRADLVRPVFHVQDYFDQMKRRLYTQSPDLYPQWASLGVSDVNWYWSQSEGCFIHYRNGKRVLSEIIYSKK